MGLVAPGLEAAEPVLGHTCPYREPALRPAEFSRRVRTALASWTRSRSALVPSCSSRLATAVSILLRQRPGRGAFQDPAQLAARPRRVIACYPTGDAILGSA